RLRAGTARRRPGRRRSPAASAPGCAPWRRSRRSRTRRSARSRSRGRAVPQKRWRPRRAGARPGPRRCAVSSCEASRPDLVQSHQQHGAHQRPEPRDQASPAAALEQPHPAAAHHEHHGGEQVAVQGDRVLGRAAAQVTQSQGEAEHHPCKSQHRAGAQQHQVRVQVAQSVVEAQQSGQTAQHGHHDAQRRHGSSILLHRATAPRAARPYDRAMPTITITEASVRDVQADVLLLPLLAGADGAAAKVPGSPEITEAIAGLDASADRGELHRIPHLGLATAGSLLLVGVGDEDLAEVSAEDLRLAFGAATRSLSGVEHAAVALPTGSDSQRAAALEGAALGAYAFVAHKSGTGSSAPKAALGALSLVAEGGADAARAAVERSSLLSEVVDIVRDLVNTPPNLLYPASFAQRAQELVADLPVTVTGLDETQLAEGGYGGIVGVGQGSTRPPRLVR